MARKAAQKPVQASPLAGCSIATSGRFPGTTQSALQSRVTSLGATIASSVTTDTTHLIATKKDAEIFSPKCEAATAHGVAIVSVDWLDECEAKDSKVDEMQYMLPVSVPASFSAPSNGSKKRTASSAVSPAPTQDAKKPKIKENAKVGDGQNSKSKQIAISVDDECPWAHCHVHIDDDGTIFDASLNQTNSDANNNKFYIIQVLTDGSRFQTWTRWGRVGERGQNAVLGCGTRWDAITHFEKKFKDKSGLKWADRGADPKAGKYAYVERSYNPDSEDEEADTGAGAEADAGAGDRADADGETKEAACTLDPPTQALMELIFNQDYVDATMKALNYDANKLPLGKLSKGAIARGFQALKDLSVLLDNTDADSRAEAKRLSDHYFSVIPHAFGRARPPVIRELSQLKKEIDLLESLSDMKDTAALLKSQLKDDSGIHRLDKQFQSLGMNEMSPLDHKSSEFTEINDYLNNSKGQTHAVSYQVQDIFRIERQGEFERFDKSKFANITSNRRLLWHGSRVTNYGGILGQGLRIAPPEAPVSGYMFGKGIYLADMSSKSANYCASYNSGGTALLLLCEAELGSPVYQLTHASSTAGKDAIQKGMYSTWGMGSTGPKKWKDAACMNPALAGCLMPDVSTPPGPTNVQGATLLYNEYIAYDVAQVKLRYLLRVRM
ncbi:PARP-domain-containing protein [Decorospora gaudefroyi]|uniref:Poly [ADP-ribose] polymerase n=1 Tax=Decorospora gaudefroyi TaxID=184978 RepID=A0A6A5KJU0_9PLEO|nr:PARP-domain-containing protein [Decorospora gaudefroyi]